MSEGWEKVAQRLEAQATGPTDEQSMVASALGVTFPEGTPAPVIAIVLKATLSVALMERLHCDAEIPEPLTFLENQLGLTDHANLLTSSREEVSAWFAARYMLLTAKGLRTLKPMINDVVVRADNPSEHLVISSIGSNGCIYMKGGSGKRAWPNHLTLISREGESADHVSLVAAVDARIRNARTDYSPSSPQLEALRGYRLNSELPSAEAIRALEDLLESGELLEGPFQRLIERYPQLLSSLVIGNWGTYVIPKQRLGTQHETDFLVLGVNSLGPQWIAVELEAPRHTLLTREGNLRQEVQHAVNQVQDWRDWLAVNISYAQQTLHLHGLTNSVPGVVIIGRDDPHIDRQAARSRVDEQQNIQIHSWDWVLRQTKRLMADGRQPTAQAMAAIDDEADEQ